MEILKFFRDYLSGVPYFFTVIISLFLIFSIIGYLVSQKYGNNVK